MGWAKRGPSGVIGTNKSDASDVVALIIEDLGEPKQGGDISVVIPYGHQVVDQQSWVRINSSEVASGEAVGKPRIKEVNRDKLLHLGGKE